MKWITNATARVRAHVTPAFELLYLACVFFMMLEIATPLPVSLYKGLYVGTFIALGVRLILDKKLGLRRLFSSIRRFYGVLSLFFLLLLYILADIVGVFYSPVPDFALVKYLVIVPMLLFLVPTIYYLKSTERLDKLYKTLALSGLTTGLLSLSNYFVFEFMPLPYIRRLSMISDYNRYAENLYISMVLGAFFLLNARFKPRTQALLLFSHLTFYAVIITLSGSRRTYILMFPALAAILLYKAFYVARYSPTEISAFKRLIAGVLITILCIGVVGAAENGFKGYSDIKYRQEVESGGGEVTEENSVENVIDTIGTGGMFDKRAVIWRVAYKEALNYDVKDILIGRGSGYEVHLYDITKDETLLKAYASFENKPKNWMSPHNFVLADFLSGGIIKLGLGLALLGAVMVRLVLLFARSPGRALPLAITMALLYFNVFISGRYGIAYDKFYYILLVCLAAESVFAARARDTARAANG